MAAAGLESGLGVGKEGEKTDLLLSFSLMGQEPLVPGLWSERLASPRDCAPCADRRVLRVGLLLGPRWERKESVEKGTH